jgi:hypothetical protein
LFCGTSSCSGEFYLLSELISSSKWDLGEIYISEESSLFIGTGLHCVAFLLPVNVMASNRTRAHHSKEELGH